MAETKQATGGSTTKVWAECEKCSKKDSCKNKKMTACAYFVDIVVGRLNNQVGVNNVSQNVSQNISPPIKADNSMNAIMERQLKENFYGSLGVGINVKGVM